VWNVQKNACESAAGQRSFMSSLQCLEKTAGLITSELCFPPKDEILRSDSQVFICCCLSADSFVSEADNIVLRFESSALFEWSHEVCISCTVISVATRLRGNMILCSLLTVFDTLLSDNTMRFL